MKWLTLVRWPNLLILSLAQLAFYFRLIRYYTIAVAPEADYVSLILLILVSCIIAGTGFIINDYYDIETDIVNKNKNKRIIPDHISKTNAMRMYWILNLIGGLISLYLSIRLQFYISFIFYPLAIFGFWYYSYALKCSVLAGNLFVALSICFSLLMIPYANWNALEALRIQDFDYWLKAATRILVLTNFVMLVVLFREIIKDIEDLEGDAKINCRTTAVYFGKKGASIIAFIVLIIAFICLFFFTWSIPNPMKQISGILILGGPLVYLSFLTLRGNEKSAFHKISTLAKLYMLLGMLYFFILNP